MLTGVIGGTHIVKSRIAQGRADGLERFADSAMAPAQRAAALTQQLLGFARRQSLDTDLVKVNELIGLIEELLRRTLGEQVTLKTDLAEAIWPVLADPNQLESAVLNLAINARDATGNRGILTIATRNVTVSRKSGMPPDIQARASNPFHTTKPVGQGTGLGLSMVYGLVQQSRGDIKIESEGGSGTRIVIHLR